MQDWLTIRARDSTAYQGFPLWIRRNGSVHQLKQFLWIVVWFNVDVEMDVDIFRLLNNDKRWAFNVQNILESPS
jgi:hypothetical protein